METGLYQADIEVLLRKVRAILGEVGATIRNVGNFFASARRGRVVESCPTSWRKLSAVS